MKSKPVDHTADVSGILVSAPFLISAHNRELFPKFHSWIYAHEAACLPEQVIAPQDHGCNLPFSRPVGFALALDLANTEKLPHLKTFANLRPESRSGRCKLVSILAQGGAIFMSCRLPGGNLPEIRRSTVGMTCLRTPHLAYYGSNNHLAFLFFHSISISCLH